jgi:hypothetical protein
MPPENFRKSGESRLEALLERLATEYSGPREDSELALVLERAAFTAAIPGRDALAHALDESRDFAWISSALPGRAFALAARRAEARLGCDGRGPASVCAAAAE